MIILHCLLKIWQKMKKNYVTDPGPKVRQVNSFREKSFSAHKDSVYLIEFPGQSDDPIDKACDDLIILV